jgi:hypothetical protein
MPESIEGRWCLIAESADETNIPAHHVSFVFREANGHPQGALINRVTGAGTPLPMLEFDGNGLKLRLPGQPIEYVLAMNRTGQKFEGYWMNASQRVGDKLKLVRG